MMTVMGVQLRWDAARREAVGKTADGVAIHAWDRCDGSIGARAKRGDLCIEIVSGYTFQLADALADEWRRAVSTGKSRRLW